MSFQNLIKEIFPIKEIKNCSEKISEFNFSFISQQEDLNLEKISELFKKFDSRDKVSLNIKIYDTISVDSTCTSFQDFISKIKTELSTIEEEEIVIDFTVSKAYDDGIINVYDFSEFDRFWKERQIGEILKLLSPLLISHKTIAFKILYNIIDDFYSENISFITTSLPTINSNNTIDINRLRVSCHFENFSSFPFTANYFYLVKRPKKENHITKKLDKIAFTFLIIGLYDITSIKDEIFYSKVNGYKSFEIEKDFEKLDYQSISEYKKLYDWVYSEKSHITDKIGLFRNILSIHLTPNSHTINDNVFISVNSGYKSYLQNSINKYIDIRSKITEQVNSISQKTNDLIERYLSNYQKSNFAFISFFISVFLLRVLNAKTSNEFQNIFNKDTTIIFFALIVISLLYFIFSLVTLNQDILRIKNKYSLMKLRNEDLLDKIDIEKILNNDAEFNSDITFLNKRKFFYTILWITTLITFILAVLSLSDYINWETIFKKTP